MDARSSVDDSRISSSEEDDPAIYNLLISNFLDSSANLRASTFYLRIFSLRVSESDSRLSSEEGSRDSSEEGLLSSYIFIYLTASAFSTSYPAWRAISLAFYIASLRSSENVSRSSSEDEDYY